MIKIRSHFKKIFRYASSTVFSISKWRVSGTATNVSDLKLAVFRHFRFFYHKSLVVNKKRRGGGHEEETTSNIAIPE